MSDVNEEADTNGVDEDTQPSETQPVAAKVQTVELDDVPVYTDSLLALMHHGSTKNLSGLFEVVDQTSRGTASIKDEDDLVWLSPGWVKFVQ